MAFPDPIVAGDKLVVPSIESVDYTDGGIAGWQINRDGSATFNNLDLNGNLGSGSASIDDLQINNSLLLPDGTNVVSTLALYDPTQSTYPVAKGTIAYGRDPASVIQTITAYPYGTIAIRGHMEAGRTYKICMRGRINGIPSTDDLNIRLQYTTDNTIPTTASVIISDTPIGKTGTWGFAETSILYEAAIDLDMWVGCYIVRLTGAGALTAQQLTTNPNWWELWIEDVGLNSRANTPLSAYAAPTSPPVATKKTYNTVYYGTWSRTYDGSNATTWDDSAYCYQGYYSSTRGNTKSLIGFDYATIMANLAGATINSIKLTVKGAHAYWNGGMIFEWGTHNYTAKPSTWNGANVTERRGSYGSTANGLAAGETITLSLGTTIGNEFKSGTSKGIAVGPGPSNSLDYYGFIYGATQSGKPYLTINYTK